MIYQKSYCDKYAEKEENLFYSYVENAFEKFIKSEFCGYSG